MSEGTPSRGATLGRAPAWGIHASLVCPMRADGDLDEAQLARHAAGVLACAGVRGLLVNGHAGEGPALTREEARRVVRAARRAADGYAVEAGGVPAAGVGAGGMRAGGARVTVVAGVAAEASAAAAALAQDAAAEGADAVMVVAPFSWALGADPRVILAHHRAIHDATELPLVLFQGVAGTGLHLSPPVLAALLGLPRVAAIKEGSWDAGAYAATRALVAQARPEVAVLASGDQHLLACFRLGSEGSLVSLAAVVPELVVALEAAVRDGADGEADALDARLAPLAQAIYAAPPPGLASVRLKACLHLLGRLPQPAGRAPLPVLGGVEQDALRQALLGAGLALPSVAEAGPVAPAPVAPVPVVQAPLVQTPVVRARDDGRPWLHIVRVDVDEAVRAEFDRWYEEEHIPALLRCPGWLSARRYLCEDGGPRHATAYEIAGPWAYATPEFAAVRGFGRLAPHVHSFQRQVLRPPGSGTDGVPAPSEGPAGRGGAGAGPATGAGSDPATRAGVDPA